jgi:hypothetical protein
MLPDLADLLRSRYEAALAASKDRPPEERLIAYDPAECAAIEKVGPYIKRLEPRRKQKQKKGTPDDCDIVRPSEVTIVSPKIEPKRFNFTKIHPEERLHTIGLAGSQYHVVVNKYPALPQHLLLVSEDLRPQILTRHDLQAIHEFIQSVSHSCLAFFNSWSAAATVNHLHFQIFKGPAPIQGFSLESVGVMHESPIYRVQTYPADNIVFDAANIDAVWKEVRRLISANQPHNLLFSSTHTYLFPRNADPNPKGREIYGEETGGIEYAGIFIAYDREIFESLTLQCIEELLSKTTQAINYQT